MMSRSTTGETAGAGRPGGSAALAFRCVVVGGLLLMLGANLPGHLSFDSVVQLHEGRTGVRETWAPAILSWLLGRFDKLTPGTGLYVTANAALLSVSLLSLTHLRARASWLAVVLTLALVMTPAFLLYQAIVWKDVLFANLTVAGFVALAHAVRGSATPVNRLAPLAGALVCFALTVLVRQNGVVVVAIAAAALAWTRRGRGWRSSAAWGLGGFAAAILLSQAIGAVAQPRGSSMDADVAKGVQVLQRYDIVGAVAHDPRVPLAILERADPHAARLIATEGRRVYSPQRVDSFADSPALRQSLRALPEGAVTSQWVDIVLHHPGAYLSHRADAFHWLFDPPVLERCLPVHVGVEGPSDALGDLGLTAGQRPQDRAMYAYAARFFHTPLFSHAASATVALVIMILLGLRRDPTDIVIAGLALAALAFAASFFFITVACDYRYLYVLDLAAMVGLVYLALDPPIPLRRGRPGLAQGATLH